MKSMSVIVNNIPPKINIKNVKMVFDCWQVKFCDGFFVLQGSIIYMIRF